MSTLSLMIVKWRDARSFATSIGYTREECLDFSLVVIETVGYLIKEDEEVVRIASERRSKDEFQSDVRFGDVTIIPTSQVISIKRVRIREPKE